jgi:hypothetical protein
VHRSQRLLIPQTRILYVVLHSLLQASVLLTAVSRASAVQLEAFWLACERGCDTLFVHAPARQEQCLALQENQH